MRLDDYNVLLKYFNVDCAQEIYKCSLLYGKKMHNAARKTIYVRLMLSITSTYFGLMHHLIITLLNLRTL